MRAPVDLVQQEADKKRAKAAVVKTGVTQRDKMRELLAEDLAMAMPEVVCGRMACDWKPPAVQSAIICDAALGAAVSRLLSMRSSWLVIVRCKQMATNTGWAGRPSRTVLAL
jgi:hypothetical protein